MGDVVRTGYTVLALLTLALLAVGLARRSRGALVAGAAAALALAGAWSFGPPGAFAGLLALPFLRRRPGAR